MSTMPVLHGLISQHFVTNMSYLKSCNKSEKITGVNKIVNLVLNQPLDLDPLNIQDLTSLLHHRHQNVTHNEDNRTPITTQYAPHVFLHRQSTIGYTTNHQRLHRYQLITKPYDYKNSVTGKIR